MCTDDAIGIRGYYFPWGTPSKKLGLILGPTQAGGGGPVV